MSTTSLAAIDEGTLQREVDETRDDPVLPDRDMAQHQRHAARLLQRLQRLPDAGIGLVDLVEEEDAGHAAVFERLQDDLQRRDLLLVGLRDDDGEIDRRQHALGLGTEFDRAGTIEDGEAIAHEFGLGDIHLDAHLVGARLGGSVADRVLFRDGSLARDRAGPLQDRFEQGCLAAGERTHECNAPGSGDSAIAVCHDRASRNFAFWGTTRAVRAAPGPIVSGFGLADKSAMKARLDRDSGKGHRF
jgi:hypothetical protein